MHTISFGSICAGALVLLGASAGARADTTQPIESDPGITAAATPTLDRVEVESWLDGFLPNALQQADIAGAMVVVIKDNQVLLQKGYGYADVEKGTRVDPDRTLFRPGSIGKLFTWTAVMQQVEQGKIDLDRDVNDYLDFRIPATFPEPITMRHLMTHMPGFEEPAQGLFYDDPKNVPTLRTYLQEHLPPRLFPPGEVPAYSNYGTALAGYIVQRVSGEDFYDYLDRHIFEPLGMRHSTFRQPLPAELEAHMAKSYDVASGPPVYYRLAGPWPAGSTALTAADMARFMIAHLRMGQGEPGGLLRPETAKLMHTTITKALPPLNGLALGFFETDRNGRRIIGHGGDLPGFHSDLNLLPDEKAGLFISYNSSGKGDASLNVRTALFEAFMDRYFAAPLPDEPTTATAVEHARLIADAGPYEVSRRAQSSFLALPNLLGQMHIEASDDGTLVVPWALGLNEQSKKWREVQPFVWREVAGKSRLAARVVDGKVQSLSWEPFASAVIFQPVPAIRSAAWNVPLLLGTLAVLALTVVFWPVTALVRRSFGASSIVAGAEARAQRWARVVALVNLVFLVGWALVMTADDTRASLNDGRLTGWIRLLHLLGVMAVAGAGVALWNAWLTWKGQRGIWAKLWSAALAIACVAIVWFTFAFHLLTLSVKY